MWRSRKNSGSIPVRSDQPRAVSRPMARVFSERLQRLAHDFAQQHLADQKLQEKDRQGYTLLLAMRRWEFEAFVALRR